MNSHVLLLGEDGFLLLADILLSCAPHKVLQHQVGLWYGLIQEGLNLDPTGTYSDTENKCDSNTPILALCYHAYTVYCALVYTVYKQVQSDMTFK